MLILSVSNYRHYLRWLVSWLVEMRWNNPWRTHWEGSLYLATRHTLGCNFCCLLLESFLLRHNAASFACSVLLLNKTYFLLSVMSMSLQPVLPTLSSDKVYFWPSCLTPDGETDPDAESDERETDGHADSLVQGVHQILRHLLQPGRTRSHHRVGSP